MLQQMRELGYQPRELAQEVVAFACCHAGELERAESIVADMINDGFQPRPELFFELMRAYNRRDRHDA
ncbi:pentatricopeptide repeat-containing protein, partial [Enterococcus faecalis]|uniref:pentatricopeptide repeat-containing protein n=1 Tax=Enterococcus faecalis TaxID=1351 RepID=UPI00403F1046